MEAENGTDKKGFEYFAFISYSHKDIRIAKRLKKRLQSYHLPTKLQKTYPTLPKKLGPIFIDEERLTGGVLQEAIRDNLDKSNYLILICSPNSAKSVYVNEEVKHFIETGKTDHIIPFIVDGVPHSGDESKECFPPALLGLPLEQELLGIDLKKFGERDSFLRVIATMLELNLDNFVSYEARERKRRAVIFTLIATTLIITIGCFIWYNIGPLYSTLSKAKQGDAITQYNLGYMYEKGVGVEQNYIKAIEWYEKAAAQGYAIAQNNLGLMYLSGLGTEQNYAKAIELFERAAAQDLPIAQNNLAHMYFNGLGTEQDYAKAMELFERAAAQGNTEAANNLGYIYYQGLGTERDYDKAKMWIEKAATQGFAEAQNNIAYIYLSGIGAEQNYVKAREWYEKAAAQDVAMAQNNLGYMYSKGLGGERDYVKARELYEKAAAQGYAEAQHNLGRMYHEGEGTKQDYKEAIEWYEKAAAQGLAIAQYGMGYMYLNGLGVPQSSDKAIEYFTKAAEQGHKGAKTELEKLSR